MDLPTLIGKVIKNLVEADYDDEDHPVVADTIHNLGEILDMIEGVDS